MVSHGKFQSHPSTLVILVTTKLISTPPLFYHYISRYHTSFSEDLPCFNLVNYTVSRLEGRDMLEGTEVGRNGGFRRKGSKLYNILPTILVSHSQLMAVRTRKYLPYSRVSHRISK